MSGAETTGEGASDKLFALIGATGLQGGATASALLATGARVRALVRDPRSAAAENLQQRGAEVVHGDLDEPESLRAALVGVDALSAMTTLVRGPEGEVEQGVAMADAAFAAGVHHVVYSSVGGAERHTGIPHFESKRRIEEHLESLGLWTTFVRPTFFMENFVRRSPPQVEDGILVLRMALRPTTPLQLVAVQDIGAVVVAALQEPNRVGASIEIAGDELTGPQIAAHLGDHAGVPARYESIPLDTLAGDFDRHAMFAWLDDLPAYQADFNATKLLAPEAHDLAGWLAVGS
jgi:uncharacterized protein YbjT (DUF2867 family)